MFCGKCGSKINDDTMFCPNCGNKTENDSTSVSNTENQSEKKKLIFPVIIGVAVLAIIVIIILLTTGGGYKKTVDNYFKAYENNDADLMYDSVVAQYWIDYTNDAWSDSAYDTIQEGIEEEIEDWDCGSDIKIDYEIENKTRATKEEVEELEDVIYSWYAYYVYEQDDFSITDAYVLDINFTVDGDEGTEGYSFPDGLLVIKENGKWRIPRGAISCSFYDNQ